MKKTIKRRRKENKTDYLKRLNMLKSGRGRIIFRKTNKYIIAQYVKSEEAQDYAKITVNSRDLIDYGWPSTSSVKSMPASYLTGMLIGKKILKEFPKEHPILDIGMNVAIKKSKVYAFLKGIIDSGIKIEYKEEIIPSKETLEGKYTKNKINIQEIKSKIEKNG